MVEHIFRPAGQLKIHNNCACTHHSHAASRQYSQRAWRLASLAASHVTATRPHIDPCQSTPPCTRFLWGMLACDCTSTRTYRNNCEPCAVLTYKQLLYDTQRKSMPPNKLIHILYLCKNPTTFEKIFSN